MKNIDGKKVERIIQQIYRIFDNEKVTGNEGSAIAGMILSISAASNVSKQLEAGREGVR